MPHRLSPWILAGVLACLCSPAKPAAKEIETMGVVKRIENYKTVGEVQLRLAEGRIWRCTLLLFIWLQNVVEWMTASPRHVNMVHFTTFWAHV